MVMGNIAPKYYNIRGNSKMGRLLGNAYKNLQINFSLGKFLTPTQRKGW